MPEISSFCGMYVYMYFRHREHNPPHVHVRKGGEECSINILTCTLDDGELPKKDLKDALRWVELHREELLEIWETQKFRKLPPL